MDRITWLAFALELVAMLLVTRAPGRWLLEHPLEVGIVLLTPPFVVGAVQAVRALRLVRLLRAFRIPGLTRAVFSVDGARFAAIIAALTAVGGGGAFASVEHVSLGDGI